MRTFRLTKYMCASALFLLIGSTAHAVTLSVKCGSTTGLSSINAALTILKSSEESHGRNTINVSGACDENVVIQSMDRLTLNAVNGLGFRQIGWQANLRGDSRYKVLLAKMNLAD